VQRFTPLLIHAARPCRHAPGDRWFVNETYAKIAGRWIEADHGRLKSRLRPMRGLKQLRCAQVITGGHAFIQNIRRGHYELGALGAEETVNLRVLGAFDELVWRSNQPRLPILPALTSHNSTALPETCAAQVALA
jgi:transposase-like protein